MAVFNSSTIIFSGIFLMITPFLNNTASFLPPAIPICPVVLAASVRTTWPPPDPISVSYTHLFQSIAISEVIPGVGKNNPPGPVSYTHLDVYKRQT